LACDGAVSSTPETVAQTFGRVPGQYSPSLFASILGIYLSKKHSEGELEIVILACGPWIAVPVQQEGPLEGGVSFNFNRLSLSVSSGKRVAGFSLFGIETRPETYRIAGMNEAVIFVVPFKALDGLSIQKNEGSLKTQTENVHLLEGDFASGTYSARSGRYNEKIDRDVVPAWQPPVPVIIGRQ
jgi:hypothetical protein